MVGRFSPWLGAGLVAAGVALGLLLGAGVAHAQEGASADRKADTSESAKTSDNKQDSTNRASASAAKAINTVRKAVHDAVGEVAKAANDNGRPAATPTVRAGAKAEPGQRTEKLINNVISAVTHTSERKVVVERTRRTEPVEKSEPADTADDAVETPRAFAPDDPVRPIARRISNVLNLPPTRSTVPLATPTSAQPTITAAASPQIDVPPVISAIGTAVFGLISFGEGVIEGPPKALPGSGVTVTRSTLTIGDQEVPADWYFPAGYDQESATPPDRIIYLQHGFLARGVFYDYTASYLASQTNSIVVAPTLTSNIFATDGMWLGGDQMHRAVANLFLDDNTALLQSAQDAGYGQSQLPQNVILVGHSLGGGLVIDVAQMMAADEQDPEGPAGPTSSYKLAGVLMLDGVSFDDPVPILEGIPDDIPVYNLSSTPNPWNLFGTMDNALAEVRGDQFHGAQLLGSWHSDAMVGGNPLIQFGAYLLTGYGGPANVDGSQILAAGWINDMFGCVDASTCDRDPSRYGQPGETIEIPTPFGPAFGLVQPKQGPVTSALRDVTGAVFVLLGHLNFATEVDQAQTNAARAIAA